MFVNRPRDDLLAGAGLAEEQHRRAAARDEPGARHDRRQPGVAANQPLFVDRIAVDQALGLASWRCGRLHFL